MTTATARLTSAEFRELDLGEESRRDFLWDGEVIHVMPPHPPHVIILHFIAGILRGAFPGEGYTVLTEAPLELRDGYQPQPDVMVLRGPMTTWARRYPTPAEVVLLVEVADSSLGFDLVDKLREYATGGVPVYWVAEVRGQVLRRFTQPNPAISTYAVAERFGRGDQVPAGDVMIAVDDVFRALDAS